MHGFCFKLTSTSVTFLQENLNRNNMSFEQTYLNTFIYKDIRRLLNTIYTTIT